MIPQTPSRSNNPGETLKARCSERNVEEGSRKAMIHEVFVNRNESKREHCQDAIGQVWEVLHYPQSFQDIQIYPEAFLKLQRLQRLRF